MLERATATRFAVPLREGGSLPGLVEASDDGMYVVKLRGAGQGLKALVAEVVVGEIGRLVGVPVPRLAVIDLPPDIARYEADEEVQDLLTASVGDNLGMDYLPGSFGYDGSYPAPGAVADAVVWLDAFAANVDRTWSNPNLLLWHREVWAIDHGAALWFHHAWPRKQPSAERFAERAFDPAEHVLVDLTEDLPAMHRRARDILTPEALREVIALVPDGWLEVTEHLPDPEAVRTAYLEHLTRRLDSGAVWLPEGPR